MKKQTFTRIGFSKPTTTQHSMLTGFLRLFLLGVFVISGLLAQAQNTTVTGGNCTGCDASMTVKFVGCNCVEISACKKLSNVVIRTADGVEKKYDGLSSKTGNFCSTNGSPIVKVWVKAGCFQSGDGPGYGRKFDNPNSCGTSCADNDNDDVCNDDDCQPDNAAYPATPGTPCNDNDPNTDYDVVTPDGCGCQGVLPNPCAGLGGDTDNDGVCNAEDCQQNNPNFPAVPGTPCNDNNPNTINDVVLPGGCACAGTLQPPPTTVTGGTCQGCDASMTVKFISCYCVEVSACKDLSNVVIRTENGVNKKYDGLSGKTATFCSTNGTPIVTVWVKAGCFQSGDGPGYGRRFNSPLNCGVPCTDQGGDTDGDGYCDNQDCRPDDPAFPTTPGILCDDNDPNTTDDKVTADGCGCEGTSTVVCDNIDLGGTIGFGPNCNAAVQYCPTTENAPIIGNCASPIGGTGPLEVVWLKSTTSCTYPTTTAAEIGAGLDPHWRMIPGASDLSYNPGNITESTCFLRCVRRAGCAVFVESNIVSLGISPNCGGGDVPDCSNISISTGNGAIIVGGTDKAPITAIQVFNSSWVGVFTCNDNCEEPTATIPVAAGTYFVKVNYFTDKYKLVCEENRMVTVVNALEGSLGESFQFAAIKHEEHTELIWSHNGGDQIVEYVLEKSVNGVDFEPILIQGNEGGNRSVRHEGYDLEPASGDNFYRVKMVGVNGTALYSDVKVVNFPVLLDYALFPNPANGFVKVNLESFIGYEDVSIALFNSFGIEMKRIQIDEVFGKSYQIDIRDLHEGQYIVWVNVPGKRPVAKKLVVGRF